MSLPGAGPPNSDERLAAALKSQSVNTGRGAVQTRSATRRPPTEPYHAPASGGVTGTGHFEAPAPAMGWQDYNTTPAITGDGAFAEYDSGSGGVIVTQDGYYQGFAWTQIINLNFNNAGVLKFSIPGLGFVQAICYGVDAGDLVVTGPVQWQTAGDLFEVNTSTVGTPGSPVPVTDVAVLTLTRFGGP